MHFAKNKLKLLRPNPKNEEKIKLKVYNMFNAFNFYKEIYDNAGVPKSYSFGNGVTTIGYTANGEASDWMLHEKGIYAMSPELGIDDQRSEDFFIMKAEVIKEVCE